MSGDVHVIKFGTCEYHLMDGKFHREDGPAVLTAHVQEWYVNGVHHREDGPARVWLNKKQCEFWHEGKLLGRGDFEPPETDQALFESYKHKGT